MGNENSVTDSAYSDSDLIVAVMVFILLGIAILTAVALAVAGKGQDLPLDATGGSGHLLLGGIFPEAEVQLEVVRLLDGVAGGGDVEGPEDAVDGGHVAVAAGEGGRQLLDHLLGEGGLADVDHDLVVDERFITRA